jgi:hypothetical protein
MKVFYKKYSIGIIILLFLCWTVLTPYPFQKGGLGKTIYYFGIFAFVLFMAGLITLLFDNFNKVERIMLTLIFSFASLFVVTVFISPIIENLFSGDYTKFFWETKDKIIVNLLFYGLILTLIIIFCAFYNLANN